MESLVPRFNADTGIHIAIGYLRYSMEAESSQLFEILWSL